MRERRQEHEEFLEQLAALAPWATVNSNRGANTPFTPLTDFLFRQRARESLAAQQPAVSDGSVAAATQPVMRYARPGERPPSKFAPEQSDGVIARFDAYAMSLQRRQ